MELGERKRQRRGSHAQAPHPTPGAEKPAFTRHLQELGRAGRRCGSSLAIFKNHNSKKIPPCLLVSRIGLKRMRRVCNKNECESLSPLRSPSTAPTYRSFLSLSPPPPALVFRGSLSAAPRQRFSRLGDAGPTALEERRWPL